MNTDPTGMCLGAYCTLRCKQPNTSNNAARPNSKSAAEPLPPVEPQITPLPDRSTSSANKNYSTSTTGLQNKNSLPSAKAVNVYIYEFKSIVPDETYEKSSKFLYRTYEHVSQPENTIKFVKASLSCSVGIGEITGGVLALVAPEPTGLTKALGISGIVVGWGTVNVAGIEMMQALGWLKDDE